ncbi:hypothetical protein [Thalassobaculum sp.]|jgi:hypothetical protein|uniref:hypothetical protein n=1 Tax=Thalassobaculum sp. TaxID=2022740 RepID=UPI0032EB5EF0
MSRHSTRDAILVVTVFGAILLMPPIIPFFDRPVSLFGMPLIVVYVFGIWLALIGLAWRLSRHLPVDGTREPIVAPTIDDAGRHEKAD